VIRMPVGGVLASLLAALPAVTGCEKAGSFETCPMTCTQKWDCKVYPSECGECKTSSGQPCEEDSCPAGVDCYSTCMVQDHPQCLEGPCLLYQARDVGKPEYRSDPFCSVPCSDDAGCGSDSKCRDVPASGKACQGAADCPGSWNGCGSDGRCLHRFCVPDKYIVQ